MLLKYSLNTIALYMLLDNNQGQAESQQHKASDIEPDQQDYSIVSRSLSGMSLMNKCFCLVA